MKRNKRKIKIVAAIAVSLAILCLVFGTFDKDAKPNDDNIIIESTVASDANQDSESQLPSSDKLDSVLDNLKDKIKEEITENKNNSSNDNSSSISLSNIPEFNGKAYIAINNNEPSFTKSEITNKSFEKYSNLDSLGRCGVVYACLGKETMPARDEERGSISNVYPSGWKQAKYDTVDGKYLYNRCHLIGWQLSAENANKKNLITGTRYFNTEGMLPFENIVADYIYETGNHVMYRVTPIYNGNELVARGVQIEAYSVEDEGDGIYFNVYCYNNQPGITINYSTGASWLSDPKR